MPSIRPISRAIPSNPCISMADKEVLEVLELYRRVYEELLAVPMIKGSSLTRKSLLAPFIPPPSRASSQRVDAASELAPRIVLVKTFQRQRCATSWSKILPVQPVKVKPTRGKTRGVLLASWPWYTYPAARAEYASYSPFSAPTRRSAPH